MRRQDEKSGLGYGQPQLFEAGASLNVIPFPRRDGEGDGLAESLLARHALPPHRRRRLELRGGAEGELVAQHRNLGVVQFPDGRLTVVGKVKR